MNATNTIDTLADTTPHKEQTVRDHLDEKIKNARECVENACIAKAKAETAGVLDYPMSFIFSLW